MVEIPRWVTAIASTHPTTPFPLETSVLSPNQFVQQHETEWERLDALITASAAGFRRNKKKTPPPKDAVQPEHAAEFPALYRQVCQHLALARDRHYPPQLIERLNRLALAGHQALYSARTGLGQQVFDFVAHDFPDLIRRHALLFWTATALMYLPAALMAILVWAQPEMIYSMLDPAQVQEFEHMYRPGNANIGFKRDSDVNFLMFGHYIQNNISIGFRCFAGGLLLGLGTIGVLLFNGMLFGALATHLTRIGYAETFFQFVVGHSAFELTAIVLCGMAGLMLGHAVISPGRLTRREAIATAARVAVKIVYGAAGMLLIAAFIEAFWSSSKLIPPMGKFIVGTFLWLSVGAYFTFMGQSRNTPPLDANPK